MRSLRRYENEVSLPEQKLDLVNASVLHEFCEVTCECRDTIVDAGFVTDAMISGKVIRDLAVIPGNVNILLVIPDERLVFLRVFQIFRLGRPVGLGVPTLIWRRSLRREHPVLDYQAVPKFEYVEEDALVQQ